jgi:hypothetical protein
MSKPRTIFLVDNLKLTQGPTSPTWYAVGRGQKELNPRRQSSSSKVGVRPNRALLFAAVFYLPFLSYPEIHYLSCDPRKLARSNAPSIVLSSEALAYPTFLFS